MTPLLSGSDFTTATGATVSYLVLAMASGIVRSYCDWSISQETDATVTLDSDGGFFALLPSLYVTAVTSVVLNGTDDSGEAWPALVAGTDWDWRSSGRLTWLRDDCGWPVGGQRITVVYSGGYVPVPDEIGAVVAMLAERIAADSTIQSQLENVGGIQTNTTYAQAVTAGAGLTDLEKSAISRYRILHAA